MNFPNPGYFAFYAEMQCFVKPQWPLVRLDSFIPFCIPPQHAFDMENKSLCRRQSVSNLFPSNCDLGAVEKRSGVQEGCGARSLGSLPWSIHTTVT